MTNRVTFKDWECEVVESQYKNGRLRLDLIDANDGSPVAVATVNIPSVGIFPDMIIIKDYSENKGMLEAFKEAGLIRDTGLAVETGRVIANVVYWLGGDDD